MTKEYNVGDTVYAKGKILQVDESDGTFPYCVAFSDSNIPEIIDRSHAWLEEDRFVEPLAKPTLPKAVADEMEKAKENKFFDVYIQRVIDRNPDFYPQSTKYWYDHDGNNTEILLNAWNNGYMVETEKKYNLILGTETDGNTNALFKNNPGTDAVLCIDADTYADDLKRDKFYQFTQEEIDKYNKDFWIKNIDLNDYKVEVNVDD